LPLFHLVKRIRRGFFYLHLLRDQGAQLNVHQLRIK
jgi:hypothetical protein